MRGLPGTKRVEVNSLGKVIKSSVQKDTIKGKNINLSLDIHLQTFALRRLQAGNDKFLDFLTIETNQMIDNNYEMKILFAGDSILKVIVEVIEVTLDDQGEAWDTKNKPKHIEI